MKTNAFRLLGAASLLAMTAALAFAGGWSIITVKEFPEQAVAGKSLTLTFTVRQHGQTLISGLQPTVLATAEGARDMVVAAKATSNTGEYAASLVLPTPGDWTLRIDGGFNPEDKARLYNSTVLPVLSVTRSAPAPAVTHQLQGKRLFVSKGCVGCHASGSDKDVTQKQFAKDYLQRFLADPSIRKVEMPNLNLSGNEIAALTAFLGK